MPANSYLEHLRCLLVSLKSYTHTNGLALKFSVASILVFMLYCRQPVLLASSGSLVLKSEKIRQRCWVPKTAHELFLPYFTSCLIWPTDSQLPSACLFQVS